MMFLIFFKSADNKKAYSVRYTVCVNPISRTMAYLSELLLSYMLPALTLCMLGNFS